MSVDSTWKTLKFYFSLLFSCYLVANPTNKKRIHIKPLSKIQKKIINNSNTLNSISSNVMVGVCTSLINFTVQFLCLSLVSCFILSCHGIFCEAFFYNRGEHLHSSSSHRVRVRNYKKAIKCKSRLSNSKSGHLKSQPHVSNFNYCFLLYH